METMLNFNLSICWKIWSFILGASCLSAAAGNGGSVITPRLALVLPGVVYGIASAWRLYYGNCRPVWSERRLLLLSFFGFCATVLFASIEASASIALACAPVSDASILFFTMAGYLQPICSTLGVGCWSLIALYQRARQTGKRANRFELLTVSGSIGILWSILMFLAGTSTLDGLEKIASCLTGGITCCASIILMAAPVFRNQGDKGPIPSRCVHKDGPAEFLRKHARRQLSDRELSVLCATARGETGKQIAQRLGVSVATVGTYRMRGYEKVGVKKKKDLMRLLSSLEGGSFSSSEGFCEASPQDERGASGIDARSLSSLLSITITSICLLVSCTYGPVDYFYQLATEDWTLGRWWPITEYVLVSVLIALSVLPTIFNLSDADDCSGHPLSARFQLTRMGFMVFCLGLSATGYLLSESSNTLCFDAGAFGLIGLISIFVYVGLVARTSMSQLNASGTPRTFIQGFKYTTSCFPEALGIIALAVLFWNDATSYWLTFFPDSWQPVTTLCILLVAALATMTVFALREAASGGVSLSTNVSERLTNYLKGRGLNDLQANVIVLTIEGKSTDVICAELHIAPGTVGSYRSRAYTALGVHNFRELHDLLIREVHIP